jgi:hypothetical protein
LILHPEFLHLIIKNEREKMKKEVLVALAVGLLGSAVFIVVVISLSDYFVN